MGRVGGSEEPKRFSSEKFFHLSLDMLCIAGTDGMFKRINPAFESTLGWTTEELTRRPFFDFVHPADLEKTRQELSKLAVKEVTLSFENRYRCADGSYKDLRWKAMPDPETDLVYAIARDVTDLRRGEQELRVAKEAAEAAALVKSRFLAYMSHEIRTPMEGVLGMTELAIQRAKDPTLRDYLEVAHQSGEALLDLLGDVLDFSRIEAGKVELRKEEFSLRECLEGGVRSLAVQAHRKDLELLCWIEPAIPDRVEGDPRRLRQVLLNLLGNAIKYTASGEIRFEVREQERTASAVTISLMVRDTGVGIPEEQIGRIFESFSRVGTGGRTAPRGSGLGLAITSELVAMMGGSVAVESEVDRGSEFQVTLPLRVAAEDQPVVEHEGVEDLRVLVIEGSDAQRAVLTRIIGCWGAEVDAVATAPAATALLEEEGRRYDVVLLDALMSGTQDLVSSNAFDRSRVQRLVLLLRPIDAASQILEATWARSDAFLMKPVFASQLAAALVGRNASPAGAAADIVGRVDSRPLRLLVADDSESNRKFLVALLQEEGHSVHAVESGREASSAVQGAPWDAVLMDLEMPEMGGLEATALIRAREGDGGAHLPILLLSGQSGAEVRERCLAAGADGFLEKPLRSRDILQWLTSGRAAVANSAADEALTASDAAQVRTDADATASGAGSVDWQRARTLVGDNDRLLAELARAVLDEAPVLACALAHAIEKDDLTLVRELAHKLKGVTRYFGRPKLHESIVQLESDARVRHSAEAGIRFDEIRGQIEVLSGSLEAWLDGRSAE